MSLTNGCEHDAVSSEALAADLTNGREYDAVSSEALAAGLTNGCEHDAVSSEALARILHPLFVFCGYRFRVWYGVVFPVLRTIS